MNKVLGEYKVTYSGWEIKEKLTERKKKKLTEDEHLKQVLKE